MEVIETEDVRLVGNGGGAGENLLQEQVWIERLTCLVNHALVLQEGPETLLTLWLAEDFIIGHLVFLLNTPCEAVRADHGVECAAGLDFELASEAWFNAVQLIADQRGAFAVLGVFLDLLGGNNTLGFFEGVGEGIGMRRDGDDGGNRITQRW